MVDGVEVRWLWWCGAPIKARRIKVACFMLSFCCGDIFFNFVFLLWRGFER